MSDGDDVVEFKKPDTYFGVRHFQVLLLFVGILTIYFMKADMSIAIVAMTDSTQNNTFNWTLKRQSVILSSYKWGYLVSKIPGGELSAIFGGKIVLVFCGAINCLASLLLPTAGSYGGWQAVCACRLIQGLAQGVLLPTLHTLIGKWAPPDERSRIGSIISAGGLLGTGLEFIIGGFLGSSFGWKAIFYFNGALLTIWTIIYLIMGSSSPQDSKIISIEERLYIQSSLGQLNKPKRIPTPWKAMLTSVPFLTVVISNCGGGWGYWVFLTEMPTYLNKVLGVNIKSSGLLSALPYFACCILCFVFGFICDYVLMKKWLSRNVVRKISNSIGSFSPAILLIALSYVTSDVTAAVTLLTLSVGLMAGGYTGFNLVHLDLAPNHAGTMLGIAGFVSNVFSIFAPLAAGFLVKDEAEPSEWRKVFFLTAGIFAASNVVFLIFGSTKRQWWNDGDKDKAEELPTEKQPGKLV